MTKHHVVSTVFNGVKGDSRVIKTAQAALKAGYNATLIGVSQSDVVQHTEIEGVRVILVPHRAKNLTRLGLWGGRKRDLRLLVGSYLKEALPEIVALKPDIIHSHDMIGVKVGATVARAMSASGKQVHWIHDIHEFVAGIKGELQEQYIPTCLEWETNHLHEAAHLLTVSDALADEVFSRYSVERPTVTYNAPNIGSYHQSGTELRGALKLAPETPLVVYVGGASDLRGCPTILKAVASLTDVHLAFVSAGPYVDMLAAQAGTLGMKNRFHVHPYVPSDQLTSFIRTASVGIHGMVHYPNGEVAMPNKLFEYLHAGLPVVVSDVASMKAFVERHGVGKIFAAGDVASCAAAIRAALTQRETLRARITGELKQTYSWEAQEHKLQKIYRILLENPPAKVTSQGQTIAATWLAQDAKDHDSRLAEARIALGMNHPLGLRVSYIWHRFMQMLRHDGLAATLLMGLRFLRRRLF